MPAPIIEDARRLVVDRVPAFSYRDGRDSLVLAMNSAASSFGRALTYSELKGRSGLAFRLIFHQDWHRFSPDALSGYNHSRHLLDALGLEGTLVNVTGEGGVGEEAAREIIHRSLTGGYPLLGMHLMDYEDWGVIAGVSSVGRLLCQTPHNETEELVENKHWPSILLRITEEGDTPDPRKQLISALRIANNLSAASRFGSFYSGRAAFRFWIDSLRNSAEFDRLEAHGNQPYEEWVRSLLYEDRDNFALDARYTSPYLERAHVNAWRLESLIDARGAAAQYLSQAADWLTGKSHARIARAADSYARQVEVLANARQYVSWEWNLLEQPWTSEKRFAQAEILEAALAHENTAVKDIRAFLSKQI